MLGESCLDQRVAGRISASAVRDDIDVCISDQPVGDDPRRRQHVRYWRSDRLDGDGRPVWVGAATHDTRVGFRDTTGQITHHIAPDVDAERDTLFRDLEHCGGLSEVYIVNGFHKIREGRNGGGDPWYTDGKLYAGVIATQKQ